MNGQSEMEDDFDQTIQNLAEEFDATPTTEDARTGIDRRFKQATEFPLKDKAGNVVAEDRRKDDDRRNENIDIDDISEYTSEIH